MFLKLNHKKLTVIPQYRNSVVASFTEKFNASCDCSHALKLLSENVNFPTPVIGVHLRRWRTIDWHERYPFVTTECEKQKKEETYSGVSEDRIWKTVSRRNEQKWYSTEQIFNLTWLRIGEKRINGIWISFDKR